MIDRGITNQLLQMFILYGSIPQLEYHNTYPNFGLHSINTIHEKDTSTVKLSIFLNQDALKNFAEDISKLDKIKEEERIRSNNATAMKAYQEYQLILKLIK